LTRTLRCGSTALLILLPEMSCRFATVDGMSDEPEAIVIVAPNDDHGWLLLHFRPGGPAQGKKWNIRNHADIAAIAQLRGFSVDDVPWPAGYRDAFDRDARQIELRGHSEADWNDAAWWESLDDAERQVLLDFDLSANQTVEVFTIVRRHPGRVAAVRWEDGPWQILPDISAFIERQRR
jgi:hypothetical protein